MFMVSEAIRVGEMRYSPHSVNHQNVPVCTFQAQTENTIYLDDETGKVSFINNPKPLEIIVFGDIANTCAKILDKGMSFSCLCKKREIDVPYSAVILNSNGEQITTKDIYEIVPGTLSIERKDINTYRHQLKYDGGDTFGFAIVETGPNSNPKTKVTIH